LFLITAGEGENKSKYKETLTTTNLERRRILIQLQTTRKGNIFELTIPKSWNNRTIAEIFSDKWQVPKKLLHEWRMTKAVLLNGKHVPFSAELSSGDKLQISLFKEQDYGVEPTYIDVEILYEDDHLLVANKPAGMKTHPNDQSDTNTLLNGLAFHLQMKGEKCLIRHIHRLDEDTSGAILFAKHELAYALLSRLLEERKIKRTYWAVVHGIVCVKKGTINQPIGRDRHHPTRRRISPTGQAAITRYELLEADRKRTLSLIQCQLDTGRTHQIRVHLSSVGYPLAGDTLYGGQPVFPRQALHARYLSIPHPFTGETFSVSAPFTDNLFSTFQLAKQD